MNFFTNASIGCIDFIIQKSQKVELLSNGYGLFNSCYGDDVNKVSHMIKITNSVIDPNSTEIQLFLESLYKLACSIGFINDYQIFI